MRRDEMTFGLELEVGDVPRSLEIPPQLGAWEQSETDVVNLRAPYENVCCDPLGVAPPVGGEINLVPAKSPAALAQRFSDLMEYFRMQGVEPTSNCISHTHVHVRVPDLRDNIERLKKMTYYIFQNQDRVIKEIHAFEPHPDMDKVPKAKTYLKHDGARKMPDWMADNIVRKARNFDDFIRLQQCGKDGVSRGRPIRYAINSYCMKHIDTVEFRMFRHTLDADRIHDCVEFARRFMTQAVFGMTRAYPDTSDLKFPPMTFDLAQCQGWINTKWDSSRGEKQRRLLDAY